jgi:hypothetical protein
VLIADPTDLLIGVINACAQNQGNRVCRDSLEVVHVETGKHLEQVAAKHRGLRVVERSLRGLATHTGRNLPLRL